MFHMTVELPLASSKRYLTVICDEQNRVYSLNTPTDKHKARQFAGGAVEKPFPLLKSEILGYFARKPADFAKFPLNLDGFSDFQRSVYKTLQGTSAGQLITYGDLAMMAGRKGAARAVGTAMKLNRIPIIIPCHRVIKSDGGIGEYSAEGGKKFKQFLMNLEAGG